MLFVVLLVFVYGLLGRLLDWFVVLRVVVCLPLLVGFVGLLYFVGWVFCWVVWDLLFELSFWLGFRLLWLVCWRFAMGLVSDMCFGCSLWVVCG